MANIQYKVITTSTGNLDAAIKVEKYVDGVLESSTPMPYQTYQQTWLEFDGFFRIQYNGSDGFRWCMEIISGINEYYDGEVIKWKYLESVNYTLTCKIKKYLVRDVNTLYTITDDSLVEVSGELNSNLFIDNGVDEIPSGTLLMTLSNPEVLCWTDIDKVPTLTATVKGIPKPQIVMSKEIDLMHRSIKGINRVTVDCKGNVLFAVSFDKKASWMMHNGTEWVAVSDEATGMTKTEFEAITAEQWQPKYETSSEMYIRCAILDETQSITTLNIDFIN